MKDSELIRLWEKTIPGGDLAGLPVNVTYRPPENLEAPRPAPPAGAVAATIASSDALPKVERAPTPPPPSAGAATIASSDALPKIAGSTGQPRAPSSRVDAATLASTGDFARGSNDSSSWADSNPSRVPAAASSSASTISLPDGGALSSAELGAGRSVKSLSTSTSFDLVDEIGRGGMGVVFRARQRSLEREVALKRLIPGKAGALEKAQFLAESLVTGVLDHPNIVSVHDLGRTPEGDFFLAMKLINGMSWHELLHPRDEAERAKAANLDTLGHIRILLEVSNAVAFAHSKGIVHRDLKPANVMVGDFGEVLLMDWGIAVDVGDRPKPESGRVPHRTSVTTPAGTPCYMPPELAIGRGAQIGPPTDIFLLGAMLHEIVTGGPPHGGDSLMAVLREAIDCEPKRYGPDVPTALQAILHRAMAKDPAARYPDVLSFRAALEHYLAHRQSVKISDAAEATLAACVSAVVPGGPREGEAADASLERNRRYGAFAEAVAGFHQALLLWPENQAAKAGEHRARVAFARAALEAGDLGLAEAQTSALPVGHEERTRLVSSIFDIALARQRMERSARRVRLGLRAAVLVIVLGLVAGFLIVRGEQKLALAERDRAMAAEHLAEAERDRARLEAWNGRLEMAHAFCERALGLAAVKRFQSAEACLLRALEIAPRDRMPADLRATWDAPGWPAAAWRLHRAFYALCPRETLRFQIGLSPDGATGTARPASAGPVTFTAAAVGRSGKNALLGDAEGRVHIFDLATGTQTALIESSVRAPVTDLALSSDRRTAAAVTSYGALRVLDLEAGREVRTLVGPEWGFICAAITTVTARPGEGPAPGGGAAGRRLLAGGSDRKVWLFDLETGKALWSVDTDDGGPPRTPASVCISPDGALGLVGLWDGSARLFELETGRQLRSFGGAMHWVTAVAFEADGKTAWLGSNDGLLRRVDVTTGKEMRRVGTDDVAEIKISPDARSALVRLTHGGIEVHALDRGEKSSEIEPCGVAPLVMAPSADGSSAVVAFAEGPPRLYDLARALRRPRRLTDLGSPDDGIAALAISLDRRKILGASAGGDVILWELRGRRELKRIATGAGARDIALSADDRRALLGAADGSVRLIDIEGGKELRRQDLGVGPIHSVALSDDGELALAASERAIVLFEPETGRERRRIDAPTQGGFSRARLRTAARSIAVASGTAVLLYDLEGSAEPRRFEAGSRVNGADVSPDGALVAAACDDRAVRLFETATGKAVRRIEAHSDAVNDLTFLADGRTLVSGSRDQTICVVDAANGTVIRRLRLREGGAPAAPVGREGGLAAMTVSRDGGLALSTSQDGAVLTWPLLDPTVPLEPPADLGPIYEVIGLRVATEGETKGAIEPVRRESARP